MAMAMSIRIKRPRQFFWTWKVLVFSGFVQRIRRGEHGSCGLFVSGQGGLPANGTGSISGFAFFDNDNNGAYDRLGDWGIYRLDIQLSSCSTNDAVGIATTDTQGYYEFDDLAAGLYSLNIHKLPTYYKFFANGGNWVGLDSDSDSHVNPATGSTDCIALEEGEGETVSFGMVLDVGGPVPPPVTPRPTPAPARATGAPSKSPSKSSASAPSTDSPTPRLSLAPTLGPASGPPSPPTDGPTRGSTTSPTTEPSAAPTGGPTSEPSSGPTTSPTAEPSTPPTDGPTLGPTSGPTKSPTASPSAEPTLGPTSEPTSAPSAAASSAPSGTPSTAPSGAPSGTPSGSPSRGPSSVPSSSPSAAPSDAPTRGPSSAPSPGPSTSDLPTVAPSAAPNLMAGLGAVGTPLKENMLARAPPGMADGEGEDEEDGALIAAAAAVSVAAVLVAVVAAVALRRRKRKRRSDAARAVDEEDGWRDLETGSFATSEGLVVKDSSLRSRSSGGSRKVVRFSSPDGVEDARSDSFADVDFTVPDDSSESSLSLRLGPGAEEAVLRNSGVDVTPNLLPGSRASRTPREQHIPLVAPPGRLGFVVDTPPSGGPAYVCEIKETCPIREEIQLDDKIMAVDDEDVRALTAVELSRLLARKRRQPGRRITVARDINAPSSSGRSSARSSDPDVDRMYDAMMTYIHDDGAEMHVTVSAPRGRLGFILGSPQAAGTAGPAYVVEIKEDSPLKGKMWLGDKIITIDDEDVTGMAAIDVSQLLGRKSAKPREIGILRLVEDHGDPESHDDPEMPVLELV